ncbi:MAG: hypothetical protein ACYDG2_00820 [Ruminiclostridium sp.]
MKKVSNPNFENQDHRAVGGIPILKLCGRSLDFPTCFQVLISILVYQPGSWYLHILTGV